MTFIKSPLNYTGGKYKLLPQIIPLFPEKINIFYDVFGGGLNVGLNVKSDKIVYNDTLSEVVDMLRLFKEVDIDILLNSIDNVIKEYHLGKYNKQGYLDLRLQYNSLKNHEVFKFESSILLYVLICHSFSNQIRFNSNREFNVPFGKGRSSFNPTLRDKFIHFVTSLKEKNITFLCHDFKDLKVPKYAFVYCDPPYLNSTATYNEKGGWNCDKELELLKFLDDLDNEGIKFALSNNLKYENHILIDWIEKNKDTYKVHYLNADYRNCNYQKKDIEVLITNY